MASPEVVDYVKEQLSAGYSPQEITDELMKQGWSREDVTRAFEAAGPAHSPNKVYPPVKAYHRGRRSVLLSLLGGILLFVYGLEGLLGISVVSSALPPAYLGALAALADPVWTGILSLVFAVAIIAGSLAVNMGMEKVGGILVLAFSVIALVGMPGLLAVVSGILGIAGALMMLREAFEKYPSPLAGASPYRGPPEGRAEAAEY